MWKFGTRLLTHHHLEALFQAWTVQVAARIKSFLSSFFLGFTDLDGFVNGLFVIGIK